MPDNSQIEQDVAPVGVNVPDIPDAAPPANYPNIEPYGNQGYGYDTSEETGDGTSAKFFKGVGESNTDKWKNRRHMAWIALGALLLGTIILWFVVPIDRLNSLKGLTDWFYIATLSITGAYIGFASMPGMKLPWDKS